MLGGVITANVVVRTLVNAGEIQGEKTAKRAFKIIFWFWPGAFISGVMEFIKPQK